MGYVQQLTRMDLVICDPVDENIKKLLNGKQPTVEDFADGGRFAEETDHMKVMFICSSDLNFYEQLELLKIIKIDLNAPHIHISKSYTMPIFTFILEVYSLLISEDTLKSFVASGADVNAKDSQGTPILHSLVNHIDCAQHLDIIRFLLDNGADIYAEVLDTTRIGIQTIQTYLNIFDCAEKYSDAGVVELLIEYIDVNYRFKNNRTVLSYVCMNEEISSHVIEYVINASTDINAVRFGMNALHYLIKSGCKQNRIGPIQLLINKGIDVNTPTVERFAKTPLMLAIMCIDAQDDLLRVVKLLLGAGASVDFKNSNNTTALTAACEKIFCPKMINVIRELITAGACFETTNITVRTEGLMNLFEEISRQQLVISNLKKDYVNSIVALSTRHALFGKK